MKKITLFLLTILISCSAWGADFTGGTKLYLKPNSNWTQANAWFAAYFCNGSSGVYWTKMTDSDDDGIYEVIVPSGQTHKNVLFLRMDPSNTNTTGNSWPSPWNQTNDLTYDGEKDQYTIADGAWSKGNGTWTKIPEMYYAHTENWEIKELKFMMGHNNYSRGKKMTQITNTGLYNIEHSLWSDYTQWAIFNTDPNSTWGGENNNIEHRANYAINHTTTGDKNLKTYNLLKADGTSTELTSYTSLNHDQTINVTTDGSASTTGGSITASSYKLTAVNTASASSGSTSGATTTISVAYTATVTLKAAAETGYKFIGWYEGNTLISKETTYTYTAENATKTITAKFEELPKDVTFSDPSTLKIGKTYGKLSYKLEMPKDRWYWISLPFNVKVSEITTTGANGDYNDLVFTEYNAETRANGGNGWINWKTAGYTIEEQTLTANKGYVIGPKTKKGETYNGITVIFPSVSTTNTVAREATDLTATNTGGTTIDDNWNIIGTGLYHEGSLSNDINYVAIPDNDGDYNYYYISSPIDDLKQLTSFAPFEAFFVQYGGTYSATATVATTSAELAPVARAKAQEQEQIYLINMNEAHTVVILNAEGSEGYTAGEDFLEMNVGSRIEMIYSFDAEDALAFNHRATEAQSIALGGYVAVAGEQTISLDTYNGNAEAVTLIDNVTGTTTDLLAEDYTFTAEVGSLDGRFTIVFAAQKAGSDTTVDCYNSIANQVIAYGTADHCTVSGLTAGEAIVVYNTMGQLVFATTADSETITLPSLTAGNYLILHNGTTNKVTLR